MIDPSQSQDLVISKLRAVGAGMDPLTARAKLVSVLNNASLRANGLPRSATLIIRRLRDPLPGLLRLDRNSLPPVAWERALNASLEHQVRIAARPALGPVPANAESVIFLNRSEMLACLAADWCDRTAITRWWWRSLFGGTGVSSAVIGEWLTSIEYVPAAVAKLAEKNLAIAFARELPAKAASTLLEAVIRRFGLTGLRETVLTPRNDKHTHAAVSSDRDKRPKSKPPNILSSGEPLQRIAPEAFAPQLERDARLLLAVALMLERSPALLRERGFASTLIPLLSTLNVLENGVDEARLSPAQPTFGAAAPKVPIAPSSAERKGAAIDPPSTIEQRETDSRDHQESVNARAERARELEPIGKAGDTRTQDRETTESTARPAGSLSTKLQHQASVAPESASSPQTEISATTTELSIETKFGGVFYLINAALALDLYGDFTRPLEPGIELSIWDFLALTGRELIGDRIERDPIWTLLAKLAGRDEIEQPGARFKPPGEWRTPPAWLNAFPERDEWSYQTTRGRLVVVHPAGFDVLDVKLGSRFRIKNIEARLASETRCYSNAGGFKRSRRTPGEVRRRRRERDLDRWTRRVADYLRARLARSPGIGPADDLATMLTGRASRIDVTPARLDVFFSLAELPIAIRLAGLDRDPGWLPAAGRAIAFHYE